jgi:hypothetical protein
MKEKSQGGTAKSGPLGVTDFLSFVYDTQPEWTLLAVKAPIEQVAGAFADMRQADRWLHDVPRRDSADVDDVDSSLVVAVQVRGNPWTVIFREIFCVTEAGIEEVAQEAKELSAELKTKAITFVGEDTSGALAYDLFEGGKLLEHAEWEEGGPFHSFKSTFRKQPELDEVGQEFADEVFREQGIYLPACYPKSEDEEAWLCVDKVSAGAIERADLIGLEQPGEDEDEDEDS